MDDFSMASLLSTAEMRKAVREARKEHVKPVSKLNKHALADELKRYNVKRSDPEPVIKAGRLTAPKDVPAPKESSPQLSVQEKRMAALAKAREARAKNLQAKKGAVAEKPSSFSVKNLEKAPQKKKFAMEDDLFIY